MAYWSPCRDLSSINIIVHGGAEEFTPFKAASDTYVLSLPSFRWIKVDNGKTQATRVSHTCHIVRETQMLVVGGRGPEQRTTLRGLTRSAGNWTGVRMGACDHNGMLNILDINEFQWRTEFKVGRDEQYKVNKLIFDQIGGE